MTFIIQKYACPTLADHTGVRAAARRITRTRRAGINVFVIADAVKLDDLRSALGGTEVLLLAGNDTTAVALASALGADACEIYTDAGGVFTADPAIVAAARPLPRLGYSEMLAICRDSRDEPGPRAVELARERHVELRVRPVVGTGAGTVIAGAGRSAGLRAATGTAA